MSEDPPIGRIQQAFTTRDSTGQAHTEFGPAFRPVSTTDPSVLQRLVPEGEAPPSQVITAFAPAEDRPSSYPAALPFVAGVPTSTTEYPGGEQPPGARWRVGSDPSAVVEALLEQSEAAGWSRMDTAPELASHPSLRQIALRRGEWVRLLIAGQMGGESTVQLLDLPASMLTSRRQSGL